MIKRLPEGSENKASEEFLYLIGGFCVFGHQLSHFSIISLAFNPLREWYHDDRRIQT
jgi:hypothetical protein